MFSKKICASLCALGLSLGATSIDTKVSAANTFADIARQSNSLKYLYNYCKILVSTSVFGVNSWAWYAGSYNDVIPSAVLGSGIGCLSFVGMVEGLCGVISSLDNEDKAKVKTLEKIVENDCVYGAAYGLFRDYPIELSDENVNGVIDNVKKGQEAVDKMNDRNLDPAERLLAKDAYDDAVKNLAKIASKEDSEGNDKPQRYTRRNR